MRLLDYVFLYFLYIGQDYTGGPRPMTNTADRSGKWIEVENDPQLLIMYRLHIYRAGLLYTGKYRNTV
jgi:hypothetical protein